MQDEVVFLQALVSGHILILSLCLQHYKSGSLLLNFSKAGGQLVLKYGDSSKHSLPAFAHFYIYTTVRTFKGPVGGGVSDKSSLVLKSAAIIR